MDKIQKNSFTDYKFPDRDTTRDPSMCAKQDREHLKPHDHWQRNVIQSGENKINQSQIHRILIRNYEIGSIKLSQKE
jgi:hypothetical protein